MSFGYAHTDIVLDLSGSLEIVNVDNLINGEGKFKRYACIHGRSNDGQLFTLLKSAITGYGATTKYSVIYVIADKHTPDAGVLRFTSVSLYCNHLDSFIARNLFDTHEQKEEHQIQGRHD